MPFVAAWKDRIPVAAVSAEIQPLVDQAPTFLGAATRGVAIAMQERNQIEAWCGRGPAARDHAIIGNHHNAKTVHLRTLVT